MFNVTSTIQSADGSNPPVDMRWATNATPIEAASAVLQLLSDLDDDPNVPASVRTTLLAIKVEAV